MPADEKLFAELTQLYGPSGYEKDVCRFIKDYIGDEADDVKVDALGNLIVFREGTGAKKKRFMSSAHMDEIGLQVTAINEDGTISIKSLGYPFYYTTYQRRVMFKSGLVGIVEAKCEMGEANHEFTKFYVDLGLTSKEETAKLVDVGDTAIYLGEYQPLAGRYVTAKAIDDRVGCYIQLKGMEEAGRHPYSDMYYVFSVQEEVGTRGSQVTATRIKPDMGVAVDVTPAHQRPAEMPGSNECGGGVAIKISDTSVICDEDLIAKQIELCKENDIKYQKDVIFVGGTDASSINLCNAGARACAISVVTHYTHGPNAIVNLDDVEGAAKLLGLMANAEYDFEVI